MKNEMSLEFCKLYNLRSIQVYYFPLYIQIV